jgi:hypothetical protein
MFRKAPLLWRHLTAIAPAADPSVEGRTPRFGQAAKSSSELRVSFTAFIQTGQEWKALEQDILTIADVSPRPLISAWGRRGPIAEQPFRWMAALQYQSRQGCELVARWRFGPYPGD